MRVVLVRTVRGFFDARGQDLAAGLAYSALLTFVPLVAAVTILASTLFGDTGVGFYRLLRFLVPGTSRELVTDLRVAIAHARTLSEGASVLFLLASLRTFFVVEGATNAVWGTVRSRPALRRLGLALVVVVLGPVAVGVATSLLLESATPFAAFTSFRWTALVLSCLLLTVFYKVVPAAHVRWGPAAAAGTVAGVGVWLLKWGFTRGIAALAGLSHIYGSISAIVVFVLAIGAVSTLLLLGVSLTHAIQFRDELLAHDEPERQERRTGPLNEAVRLLLVLAHAREAGAGPVPLAVLSDEVRRTEDEARSRLKKLAAAGLAEPTGEDAFRLARAPEEISLYTVARSVGDALPRPIPIGDDAVSETLRALFRRADREERGVLMGTSLKDLVRVSKGEEAGKAR